MSLEEGVLLVDEEEPCDDLQAWEHFAHVVKHAAIGRAGRDFVKAVGSEEDGVEDNESHNDELHVDEVRQEGKERDVLV